MNAYFDRYVLTNKILNEFVVQYDKVIMARQEVKEEEGFQTMNTQASLSGSHLIKRTSGPVTHGMFQENSNGVRSE